MKQKFVFTVFVFLTSLQIFAQTGKTQSLIDEGVALFDKGKYHEAIAKYKESYQLDSNNIVVYCEMAMTYLTLKDYTNAEAFCQQALAKFPNDPILSNIYTTYGTCLDDQKKPEEALKIYTEGLAKFPDSYMLHFNKGITEYGLERDYDARTSFQNAIKIKPKHSSSWYYLGILENNFGNRIPAILCISRFLILEPKGPRAEKMLPFLIKKVNNLYYQEKTATGTATYSSAKGRSDTTADNFTEVEQGLSLLAVFSTIPGLEKKQTELEEFETHIQTICELMTANKKDKDDFNWKFVAPYFMKLESEKYVKTFTYYINYYVTDNKDVEQWVNENAKKVNKFIEWNKDYKW